MTSYDKVTNERDIRFIGQRCQGQQKRPNSNVRAPGDQVVKRETSLMPNSEINMEQDPVYNIALQNPLAQPGGGAATWYNQRNDIAEIYGWSKITEQPPSIFLTTPKNILPGVDYQSSLVPAAQIENKYYGNGARVTSQTATSVYVTANDKSRNRGNSHTKDHKANKRGHDRDHRMTDSNAVVWNGTCLTQPPLNSYKATGQVYVGQNYKQLPPKAIVSSKDATMFVAY